MYFNNEWEIAKEDVKLYSARAQDGRQDMD